MSRIVRFIRSAVIDILLLISVSLAAGHYQKGVAAMTKPVICGIGPAVLDQRLLVDPSVFLEGRKVDVQMEDSLGGGCLNSLRAARQFGGDCRPLVFVGNDPARQHLEALLKEEFSDAVMLPMLQRTRRSVLCGNTCATIRPPMVNQTLPESARQHLRNADLVIVAPLTGRDTAVVADVLQQTTCSILLLSDSQLADAETAAQLSRLATWTIVNRRELAGWTGCESLEAGLLVLQGLGVENLLVTGADGVVMLHSGEQEFQPSFSVPCNGTTVGAGDTFTGTFAAMLAEGQPWREAVRLGQAAAAMHLTRTFTVETSQQLKDVAEELPTVPVDLPPLPFRRRGLRRRLSPLSVGIALAATLMTGTLLNLSGYFA